jgi:hypothetical protein
MAISSDQFAQSESQIGAIGLAVVTDQAVGIGVTAVPTPITDLSSDSWFLHRFSGTSSTVPDPHQSIPRRRFPNVRLSSPQRKPLE